jgi:hypothetical protein
LHFPFSHQQQIAHVTTLHGRLDLPTWYRFIGISGTFR